MPNIWSKAILTNLATHFIHQINPQITFDSSEKCIQHTDEDALPIRIFQMYMMQAWRERSEEEQDFKIYIKL